MSNQPLSNRAWRALDVVCKRDVDHRVEDQRRTIARLRCEIEAKNQRMEEMRRGEWLQMPHVWEGVVRRVILSSLHPNPFAWRRSRYMNFSNAFLLSNGAVASGRFGGGRMIGLAARALAVIVASAMAICLDMVRLLVS